MEKEVDRISDTRLINWLKAIQKYSAYTISAGLAISIALTYIALAIFLISLISDAVISKKCIRIPRSGLELPIAAMLLIFIISSLSGIALLHSLSEFRSELIFIIFFVYAYGVDLKTRIMSLKIFAIATAVAGCLGIVQYSIGITTDPQGIICNIPSWLSESPLLVIQMLALKDGRIISTRNHPLTYAEGAVFGLVCIMTWLILEKNVLKRWLWVVASIVTFISIVFSYSRGAWLGLIAAIPMLLIVKKKKIIRFRYVTLMALGIAFFIFIYPQTRIRALSLDRGSKGSNAVRIILWKTGIDIFKDYPILGIGPGTLGLIYNNYKRDEIPDKRTWTELHNQYLQIAVERGLIGLGVFMWLLTVMFARLYYTWKQHINIIEGQLPIVGIACLAGLIVMCFTENAFFDSEIQLIIWSILGMTHYEKK